MAEKFHLSGEDAEFKSRSNDIFSQVDNVKNELLLNKHNIVPIRNKRKAIATDKKLDCKPGYEAEPQKWTKYNLEETSVSDDRQNTRAALSFLHELDKRPKTQGADIDCEETKVDMSMQVESQAGTNQPEHQGIHFKKPAVHTMPEYVIGKEKTKLSKHGRKEVASTSKLSCDKVELEHLEENVSAAEYQADMAAKLDEKILLKSKQSTSNNDGKSSCAFKSRSKGSKAQRNVRKRGDEEVD